MRFLPRYAFRNSLPLVALALLAAALSSCGDALVDPPGTVSSAASASTAPVLDESGEGALQSCITDGACLIEGLVVEAEEPDCNDAYDLSCGGYSGGSPTTGGGSAGGSRSVPGDLDGDGDAYEHGPGAFAACVGALAFTAISTASLKLFFDDVYQAAGALSSAERELQMVQQNGTSLETILMYQQQRDRARQEYDAALRNLALAGGGTFAAVGAAVIACSPTLLLPTP